MLMKVGRRCDCPTLRFQQLSAIETDETPDALVRKNGIRVAISAEKPTNVDTQHPRLILGNRCPAIARSCFTGAIRPAGNTSHEGKTIVSELKPRASRVQREKGNTMRLSWRAVAVVACAAVSARAAAQSGRPAAVPPVTEKMQPIARDPAPSWVDGQAFGANKGAVVADFMIAKARLSGGLVVHVGCGWAADCRVKPEWPVHCAGVGSGRRPVE